MKTLLFDIGANHGHYTETNRKNYESCVLVEANPNLMEPLRNRFKQDGNVRVINAIISNKPSEIFHVCTTDTLSTADREWIYNSRFTNSHRWFAIEGLPTLSLDSLIQVYGIPDHIKIDVEGYEYNVLQSLTQKVPSLNFEWAEEKKSEILLSLEYLSKLGFTKFYLQSGDAYDFQVKETDWCEYQTIYNDVQTICNPERKDKWGMIWAL